MKNLFLFFSHKLTEEQSKAAVEELNCSNIIELPENLQFIWSNIPPDKKGYDLLNNFKQYLLSNYKIGDYALIQGDWGYTYNLVNFCKKIGVIAIYSTTHRNSYEKKDELGNVVKQSIFKHVMYKEY